MMKIDEKTKQEIFKVLKERIKNTIEKRANEQNKADKKTEAQHDNILR